MPWKETDVRSERIRFVVEAAGGQETMRALCERFGISRKTGYKWLRRWEQVGSLGALDEHSRRLTRFPSAASWMRSWKLVWTIKGRIRHFDVAGVSDDTNSAGRRRS